MKRSLVFVAFGMTGDLMRQKILPAIAALREKGKLPEDFRLVGISRRVSDESGDALGEAFYPLQGDVGSPDTYQRLAELLDSFEKELGKPVQKIFYISVSPALYKTVFEQLGRFAGNTIKLMVEKPFGLSGSEAQKLDEILHRDFKEGQIYRVDHYLGKASIQKLTGALHKEGTHRDKKIERIEIRLLEMSGVEKRGASYDAVGALRDVGQNHLLEVLAVAAGANTPASRAHILGELAHLSPEEVREKTTRAQYAGYREVPGVAPDSQTETYFKIETFLDTLGFGKKISVLLEAGKKAPRTLKELVVIYQNGHISQYSLEEKSEGGGVQEGEYERLLRACMFDDQRLFVSAHEVTLLWRFVDPILQEWHKNFARF
jgi:glucose-6-phosphate 1-dehydrogenase